MLEETMFRRKFSLTLYKNRRLMLAEMKFGNKPLKTERGDIYPRLFEKGVFEENCSDGKYIFEPGNGFASAAHLMGRFNPYSTYEIAPAELPGEAKAGFLIAWPENMLYVYARREGGKAVFCVDYAGEHYCAGEIEYAEGMKFLFTFHAGIYIFTLHHCPEFRLGQFRMFLRLYT